jgi:hypothetical protein
MRSSPGKKTFISTTLAYSQEIQRTNHEYLRDRKLDTVINEIVFDSIYPMMAYDFKVQKISGYTALNHKFNKQTD